MKEQEYWKKTAEMLEELGERIEFRTEAGEPLTDYSDEAEEILKEKYEKGVYEFIDEVEDYITETADERAREVERELVNCLNRRTSREAVIEYIKEYGIQKRVELYTIPITAEEKKQADEKHNALQVLETIDRSTATALAN